MSVQTITDEDMLQIEQKRREEILELNKELVSLDETIDKLSA